LLEAAGHGPQNHQEVRVTHKLTRQVEGLVGRPTAVRKPGSSIPGRSGPKAGRRCTIQLSALRKSPKN